MVNTCSFIEPAQQESVNSILEMAEYKKFGRAQKLIVAGCMVERYRNEIREQIPEVDAVIGTGEVEKILAACEGELDARCGNYATPSCLRISTTISTPRILADAAPHGLHQDQRRLRPSLHLLRDPAAARKIPQPPLRIRGARSGKPRGGGRARNFADRAGHHLLRRRPRPARRPAALLERLAQVEDLHWVRFLYCYPNRITPRLLDTIAAHPRLAKYIDIPLQHASRSVLARMKRGSHADAFLKMLEKIRATIPGVSIRTSFIVGFPGETEQDFQELCDFVDCRRIRLDGRLLVFRRRRREKL